MCDTPVSTNMADSRPPTGTLIYGDCNVCWMRAQPSPCVPINIFLNDYLLKMLNKVLLVFFDWILASFIDHRIYFLLNNCRPICNSVDSSAVVVGSGGNDNNFDDNSNYFHMMVLHSRRCCIVSIEQNSMERIVAHNLMRTMVVPFDLYYYFHCQAWFQYLLFFSMCFLILASTVLVIQNFFFQRCS